MTKSSWLHDQRQQTQTHQQERPAGDSGKVSKCNTGVGKERNGCHHSKMTPDEYTSKASRAKGEGEILHDGASRSNLFFAMYHRQWEQVSRMLFRRMGRGARLSLEELEASMNTELNENVGVLHMLCRFQPPAELLERVLKVYGDHLVRQRNEETGQYPLHVACQHGCLSAVVTLLLESFPEAAMAQDLNGQVPLHLACRPFRWCPPVEYLDIDDGEEGPEIQYIQPGSAVIYVLCQHTPEASNVNDLDDRNALEIAIEEDVATKNICKILMDASDKAWKQMVLSNKQRGSSSSDISVKSFSEACSSDSEVNGFPAYYTRSAARERLRLCRSEDIAMARERPFLSRGPTSFCELSSCLPSYEEMLEQYRVRSPSQRSFVSLPPPSAGPTQELKAHRAKKLFMHFMPSPHSHVSGAIQADTRPGRRRREEKKAVEETPRPPEYSKSRTKSDNESSSVNVAADDALDLASDVFSQVSSRNNSYASISSSRATVDVTRTDILSRVQQQMQLQQTEERSQVNSGRDDRKRAAKNTLSDSHERDEICKSSNSERKHGENKSRKAVAEGATSLATYSHLDKTASDDSVGVSCEEGSSATSGGGKVVRMIVSFRGKATIKSRRLRMGRAA